MDIKDLIRFKEVCENKSLTKTAAKIFISPQGLSKRMKSLESELGVTLFKRTPNGIVLTPYGQCLYNRSQDLIQNFNSVKAELELMKQHERGYIHICSAFGVLRILGPEFILDFEKAHPNTMLDYTEYPDVFVEQEIENGNCDVGFAICPTKSPDLDISPLFSSTVSLLVYKEHPLAQKSSVRFSDLQGEHLILESKAFKINDLVQEKCMENGFEPDIIFHTSGFSLCHKLASQQMGISVIVDLISADMPFNNLVAVPFEDSFAWKVDIICKKEYQNFNYIRVLKAYAQQYVTALKLG